FDFLVHWAPKRQRIYRAKFFVFFGTIRLDTKFELLMSITFLKKSLLGNGSDGGLPSVCAVPVGKRRTQRVCCPTREPRFKPGATEPSAGRRAPARLAQLHRLEMVVTVVTLTILHDLWRWPDHFNLSADFLNLRGLLPYGFG